MVLQGALEASHAAMVGHTSVRHPTIGDSVALFAAGLQDHTWITRNLLWDSRVDMASRESMAVKPVASTGDMELMEML